KYVPELEFVEILMGDEPSLDLSQVYYQRLLAGDADEALEVVQNFLKEHSMEEAFDTILIPALSFTKRDASRNKLSDEDQQFIFTTTRELAETIEPRPAFHHRTAK